MAEEKKTLIIHFIGKKTIVDKKTGKEKIVLREAPTFRKNGSFVFNLPSDSEQKKGFSHPDAELLLNLYRKDFKKKLPKGKSYKL